jgi:hypothetical protein
MRLGVMVGTMLLAGLLAAGAAYAQHNPCGGECGACNTQPNPSQVEGCLTAGPACVGGQVNAPGNAGPKGCVCVSGTCLNNLNGAVPAQGCPTDACPHK